jgi:hypothetical protein
LRRFQTVPANAATLQTLFAKPGITGLAVVLGAVSGGLACRDFDDIGAYNRWAAENPGDAATLPTAQTARGRHIFGRLDDELFADLGDGELRADSRHLVVLPPSVHPDGPTYRWLNPLPAPGQALPLLPESLLQSPVTSSTQATQQPKQHIACVPKSALAAIEGTLPTGPGQRNRRLFDLARRLKGILGLDTSPAMLKAIVTEWHRQALPVITTKDFAETWSDFQVAWLRVKVPHGAAVTAAYKAASRAPQPPIDDNPDLGILDGLCSNLGAGGRPFFLAARAVETLFGVPRMTAWRWLQTLAFYGAIELVETGTLKDRQAKTWRYVGG